MAGPVLWPLRARCAGRMRQHVPLLTTPSHSSTPNQVHLGAACRQLHVCSMPWAVACRWALCSQRWPLRSVQAALSEHSPPPDEDATALLTMHLDLGSTAGARAVSSLVLRTAVAVSRAQPIARLPCSELATARPQSTRSCVLRYAFTLPLFGQQWLLQSRQVGTSSARHFGTVGPL